MCPKLKEKLYFTNQNFNILKLKLTFQFSIKRHTKRQAGRSRNAGLTLQVIE